MASLQPVEAAQSASEPEVTHPDEPQELPPPTLPPPPPMNNKTWTTEEEYRFLESWAGQHSHARQNRQWNTFWASVFHAYFAKFDFAQRFYGKPKGQLTTGEAKVVEEKAQARRKQIKEWYNNNKKETRKRGQGVANSVLKSFEKNRRPHQVRYPKKIEVFSCLYYRKMKEGPIRDRVTQIIAEKRGGQNVDPRTRKLNAWRVAINEAWGNTSDQQKTRVEHERKKECDRIDKERQEEKQSVPGNEVADRMTCLQNLNNVVGNMLRSLHDRTKLNFTLIAAGVGFHVGKTPNDKDFESSYNSTRYDKLVSTLFQEFTWRCIDQETCEKLWKENAQYHMKKSQPTPASFEAQPSFDDSTDPDNHAGEAFTLNFFNHTSPSNMEPAEDTDQENLDNDYLESLFATDDPDSLDDTGPVDHPPRPFSSLPTPPFDESLIDPSLRTCNTPPEPLLQGTPAPPLSTSDKDSDPLTPTMPPVVSRDSTPNLDNGVPARANSMIPRHPTPNPVSSALDQAPITHSRHTTPNPEHDALDQAPISSSRHTTPDEDSGLAARVFHPHTPTYAKCATLWFLDLRLGSQFEHCIIAWLTLEESIEWKETSKHLPLVSGQTTGNCPASVHHWIKCCRHVLEKFPPIDDIEVYRGELLAWWLAMQPEWRQPQDGSSLPLKCYNSPDEWGWASLACSGKDGLFLLLVTMAWWGRIPEEREKWVWEMLLDDVLQVFKAMLAAGVLQKERMREDQEAASQKRPPKRKAETGPASSKKARKLADPNIRSQAQAKSLASARRITRSKAAG